MTTGCDQAVWSEAMSGFFFAANDGVNGCELHVHHPATNTTAMVVDLHPSGDALPGRDLGFSVVDDGERLLFDATDGATARQLWSPTARPRAPKPWERWKPETAGVGQRLALPFNHQPTCLDQR